MLDHGIGSDSLVLDRIGKDKRVNCRRRDDHRRLAGGTAGSRRCSRATSRSARSRASDQTDTDVFKQIQVQPFVDLSRLESVLVLIPKHAPWRRKVT